MMTIQWTQEQHSRRLGQRSWCFAHMVDIACVWVPLRSEHMFSCCYDKQGKIVSTTYRSCKFDGNLGHADESLVEVLDRLGSILGSLVTNIADSSLRKESGVRNGEFAKVLFEVVLTHGGRKTSHEYARRLLCGHDCRVDACVC